MRWWRRTQCIRTAAEMPLEVALLATEAPPVYQQIAAKALYLHQLGFTYLDIARRLGVNDKTVAKSIRWLQELLQP